MMSRMSRLTAWLASARGLDHWLGGAQRIGRRGEEELDELRFSWERAPSQNAVMLQYAY